MNKILGVGVIGCGQIAQIAHLPFINELSEFESRAICDISQNILNTVGKRFCVSKCYLDYRDLVKQPDIDVVLVSTVDHAEIAVAAMDAGKHVLCEKPMAFNLEQCDAMIEASKRNNVKLMIAYMKRYDPAYQFALPLLHEIKDLRLIRVHDLAGDYHINNEIYDLYVNSDVPMEVKEEALRVERDAKIRAIGESRADLVEAYGLLLGLCSHDSIVLHEAFGSPTKIKYVDIYSGIYTVAILEYGNSVRCVWESGYLLERPSWDEHLFAYGENRALQIEFPFPYLKNAVTYVNVNENENGVNVQKRFQVSFDEAFKREWRHLYECIVEDKEPITGGEKGRRDIAFLIDLVKASRP